MQKESKKLRVNVVSESSFTVKGHGVDTAFQEMVAALEQSGQYNVLVNSFKRSDVIQIHTIGLFSLWNLLLRRGKKIVSAHVVPDSFIGSFRGARFWHPLAKRYLRWFYNRANMLFAVSADVSTILRQQLGVKRPITVVKNTVNTARFSSSVQKHLHARQALGIMPKQPVVISVGQIQPRKHFDQFLELARQMPDVTWLWVGGLPFGVLAADERHMKQLIKSAPSNVQVTGVIDFAKVPTYYQAADVFVLLSEQETFGTVVIEAAAAGLPIIAKPLSVYQESFGGALLYQPDVAAFAWQIKALLANPEKLKACAKISVKLAQSFDTKTLSWRLHDVYSKLGLLSGRTSSKLDT